jgi:predicted peptidase
MKNIHILCSTLLALSLIALSLAGCRVHPSLQPDHPRLVSGVTVQDVSFFSAALQRQMPYRVFLPAKLLPGQKLPVVYLLHGNGGRFSEWSNGSDVAQ